MRYLSIDGLLADLNVAVDHLGGAVDLIGICQGGWMGLVYAARFPDKVRRLVIAGAPVDLAAGELGLSRTAAKAAPMSLFEDLVALGEGRVLGQRMLELWGSPDLDPVSVRQILQSPADEQARLVRAREARFRAWYATTVDLPGTYYLQVVGVAVQGEPSRRGPVCRAWPFYGRRIDLSTVQQPLFLLAARDDEFVAPGHVLNTAHLVGTAASDIRQALVPGSHLTLFMGRTTLAKTWPRNCPLAAVGRAPRQVEPSRRAHLI